MQNPSCCLWPAPDVLKSPRVSACCMRETCFWPVTHAACQTMRNRSSLSLCESARRPAAPLQRALQLFPCSLAEQTCKQLHFPSEVGFFEIFFLDPPEWGVAWIQHESLGGCGGEGLKEMIQPDFISDSFLNRVERDLLTPEKG